MSVDTAWQIVQTKNRFLGTNRDFRNGVLFLVDIAVAISSSVVSKRPGTGADTTHNGSLYVHNKQQVVVFPGNRS